MKKILSFMAVMLLWAVTANAQIPETNFAAPGYYCSADAADLGNNIWGLSRYTDSEPHYIVCNESTNDVVLASWTIQATSACYITVSLDLGPTVGSNKHIFQVKVLDENSNVKGTVAESAENATSEQVVAIDGSILIPSTGIYTIELLSIRPHGKGTIKNVILNYSADAPAEIIEVSSVELNTNAIDLEVDEVELLSTTVLPDNATNPSVAWESSNPAVATVSDNGFVTAIAAGTANITATAGEQTDVCVVTVSAASVPNVNFASAYTLSGKIAHLDGKIWKNENYKLYGDGGSNKHYGTASWTIHVTRPASVTGQLKGVEGGHIFVLDLYNDQDQWLDSIAQQDAHKWWTGDIDLNDGGHNILTFPAAGDYKLVLRNTQEWSSGKVAGVTLTPYACIAGTMTDWGTGAVPMTEVSENLFATPEMSIMGYHEFKPIINGSWYHYWADGVNATLSDVIIEAADNSEEPNFKFSLPYGNVYYLSKFYWDAAASKVYVKTEFDLEGNTFSVVGQKEILGVEWAPTAEGTEMTYNGDGTYTFVKHNVTLIPGKYGYKVACNHSWNLNYGISGPGSGNDSIEITTWGVYDITFSFDMSNEVISAIPSLVSAVNLADGYYLIGNIGGVSGKWNIYDLSAERLLTVNPANTSEYMVTTTLVANDELQVVEVENNAIKKWYPGGTGNNYIISSQVGLKTIFFRPAQDGGDGWHHGYIYIGSPVYIRAATADVWGSICLPYEATLTNAKAYYIAAPANPESGTITVEEVVGNLEAGKTYLIKALSDGNIIADLSGDKVTTPIEVNGLYGNLAAEPAVLAVNDDYDYYILSGGMFHQLTGTATASVAQYKGYLRIAKSTLAPSQLRIVEAENNTTDVKSVEANEKAVKFFENGQLRILRDGVVYDATGRVVR